MRRFFLASIAALLGVAFVLPARPATAFEAQHADLQRRITQLEGMLEGMQQKVEQVEQASFNQPSADDMGSQPMTQTTTSSQPVYRTRTYYSYPTDSGLIGSVEFGFIRPFATNGDLPNLNTAATVVNGIGTGPNLDLGPGGPLAAPIPGVANGAAQANINYQIAPRFTFGYVIPGGMGLRARYFQFDHTTTLTDPGPFANTISSRLRCQTLDVETFGTLRRGRNSGTVFGGYRYADFNTASAVGAVGFGPAITATQGAAGQGITGGITGTSIVGQSGNLSINSGIRGSAMMGDIFATHVANPVFLAGLVPPATAGNANANYNSGNNFFTILETTLGSTYRRRLSNGTQLVIGSSIEFQLWQGAGSLNPWTYLATNAPSSGVVGTPGSFGMFGFWNSFGFSY